MRLKNLLLQMDQAKAVKTRPLQTWLIAFIFCSMCASSANASWLSKITGIDLDLSRGTLSITTPDPSAIGPAIANLPKDVSQAFLNPAAAPLATAIRFSRGQALNAGVQPVPDFVKNELRGYIPDDILNKARWTTENGRLSLDTILSGWLGQEGAITLDEVIVFSSSRLATDRNRSTIELWAHELTHVMQYDSAGVETFAFLYSTNFEAIEREARDNASNIMRQKESRLASPSTPSRNYIVDQRAANRTALQWDDVSQAARQAIDPVSCIWINSGMTGNSCPIGIWVSGVVMVNQVGQQAVVPCNEPTCYFGPNMSGPLLSPWGWRIIGVTAAYRVQ